MSRAPTDHLTDDEFKHLLDEVDDSVTAAASAYGPELRAALHELDQLRDAESDLTDITEERDRLSLALEVAARDGYEFDRMQAAIAATRESGPGESPGITGIHREIYVAAWTDVFDRLIDRLRSEGLMPS